MALEAKLVITAVDETAKAFEAIKARIAALGNSVREVGRYSGIVHGVSSSSPSVASASSVGRVTATFGELGATMSRVSGDAERAARGLRDLSTSANAVTKASREAGRASRSMHEDRSGRQIVAGIAGAYIAHGTAHFARESLHAYRHFDNERRYGKAVMGITDEQQRPLVDQAIRLGGTTRYNDIQVLEAQRELAARGLGTHQVLALTGVSASLGQAMDKSLPDAAKALEGGLFGFGRDTSTFQAALENAQRTADRQVKAAKISGMDHGDIVDLYKYGATPFRQAGLGESQLLAFGGLGKRNNMGGAEMGTAARALAASLLQPTSGARTAMLSAGIDYSKFQRSGKAMDVDSFTRDVAQRYGVALSTKARDTISRVFNDKAVVADSAKFMPAIMKALGSSLGAADAKSKKSIAGEARRYRDASMGSVDSQALLKVLVEAMKGSPNLANAVFGSKQGGRISAALKNGEFDEKTAQIESHSGGYADQIARERQAGFDGAVSRFEGAVLNLETALPRAFDNDGKGGLVTNIADKSGRFIQALVEAPPALQRLATEAGLAAAAFAGLKGLQSVMGGFGLKESAAMLSEAARELMGAARVQTVEGAAGALPGGSGGKPGAKVGVLRRAGRVLKWIPGVGFAYEAVREANAALNEDVNSDASPEDKAWIENGGRKGYRDKYFGPWKPDAKRVNMGGNAHRLDFHPPEPLSMPNGGKVEAVVTGPVTAQASVDVKTSGKIEVSPSSHLLEVVSKIETLATGAGKADTGKSLPEASPRGNTGKQ